MTESIGRYRSGSSQSRAITRWYVPTYLRQVLFVDSGGRVTKKGCHRTSLDDSTACCRMQDLFVGKVNDEKEIAQKIHTGTQNGWGNNAGLRIQSIFGQIRVYQIRILDFIPLLIRAMVIFSTY